MTRAAPPDRIQVQPGKVAGRVHVPGSKSITHRALLLAAHSEQPCIVRGPLMSADTRATLAALHQMGARVHLDPEERGVQFVPAPLRPPRSIIDCANSGTTLRLLAGTVARFSQPVSLDGDASLRARPNGGLVDALRGLGASVESDDGRAPLTIRGPIRPGTVELPPATSSQFASSLLLSLPFLPGDSTLALRPPVASAPYLDITCQVAAEAGLRIERGPGDVFRVPGGQQCALTALTVEGDWSTAAFPLAAAAVSGGRVVVQGVRPASAQGDRRILDILAAFGARLESGEDGVACEAGPLHSPGVIDISGTPDLFPILAVVASLAQGTTTFTGGSSLRAKESDRIAAMAAGLKAMGAHVREMADGLVVTGGALQGTTVASNRDHRIHMAFVVAGLAAGGTTTVDGAGSAAVSYPRFHSDLAAMGARISALHGTRTVVA